MTILALDLGTTCGWAARIGTSTSSGVWNLKGSRFEGGGMRFIRFRQMLDQFGPVDRVAYEEVRRHMGVDAAHIYGGFQSHLTAWCEEHQIPYEAIPVGTIKKRATGKGNADKDKMLTSARAKWPEQNIADDNQADALWLLDCATSAEAL